MLFCYLNKCFYVKALESGIYSKIKIGSVMYLSLSKRLQFA